MRVIFLDVDGVLNIGASMILEPQCVKTCDSETLERDGTAMTRGRQIRKWLCEHPPTDGRVVLDDTDDGISEARLPFVRTDSRDGLTAAKADEAIQILRA